MKVVVTLSKVLYVGDMVGIPVIVMNCAIHMETAVLMLLTSAV